MELIVLNPKFHVVLFEPEIPPNTGNIIRLCANTGSKLHLIHPLGFRLNDRNLRRAGLDYKDRMKLQEYQNFEEFIQIEKPKRLFPIETSGKKDYHTMQFKIGDFFIFGSETKGLSQEVLQYCSKKNILKIPMVKHNRSINLSNTVAIVLYEAWRQQSFR